MKGSEMKELRERYGLTQYDVCRYVGVSDVAYRTWEQGVREPTLQNKNRLIRIYNILRGRANRLSRGEALEILREELGDDGK